jgi:hypothetical protein
MRNFFSYISIGLLITSILLILTVSPENTSEQIFIIAYLISICTLLTFFIFNSIRFIIRTELNRKGKI